MFVQDPDADVAAEESAGTGEPVGDHEVLAHHRRVLATERRVQDPGVGRHGSEREVDLVVEIGRAFRVIDELDAHVLAERHRDPRVETAAFLRALQRRRDTAPAGRATAPKKSGSGTDTLGSGEPS